ncbi:uncharacterized [Tachysurus ichikawai]
MRSSLTSTDKAKGVELRCGLPPACLLSSLAAALKVFQTQMRATCHELSRVCRKVGLVQGKPSICNAFIIRQRHQRQLHVRCHDSTTTV